tara:strand:+ start:921 stop:1466 length:546 start_codon:yes stop_codon:yes gene_type:complete
MKSYNCYMSYRDMLNRCYNPNNKSYLNYGGRGITVCPEWKDSFWAFLEDMGERPDGYSIERIDVNGDYTPENCKWISRSDQQKNKRNTVYVSYKGKEHRLAELAEELGVNYNALHKRIFKLKLPEDRWAEPLNAPPTHCKKGLHLMTDARTDPKTGLRKCRQCEKDYLREWRAARRLLASG